MPRGPYYVYALKDPRTKPPKTFYVGKGTGLRAAAHAVSVDDTLKGRRIAEIQRAGFKVWETVLVGELDEAEALRIEAEIISTFGTEELGGILTNSVVPSGRAARVNQSLVVPQGTVEKAQLGLTLLKDAVLELARANRIGVTNADVAKGLGLQSDYGGGVKDYLSYSLLGLLMREGKLTRVRPGRLHTIVGTQEVFSARTRKRRT